MTEKNMPMTNKEAYSDITVLSSWQLENKNNDLKNTISCSTSDKSVELEDVVQLDTCVRLIQTADEFCTITLALPETSLNHVKQLTIVSEARIIEAYGSCDEYLSTHTAEYVDDFEDCAVYVANISLKPTRKIMIKFQKTKHADSLWLYGINLGLYLNKPSQPRFSNINFQSVNEMLKDAKVPLSENAERCKTFLQNYSGTFDHSQISLKNCTLDPQTLMKMLEAEYFNPLGERGKNMSKCISNWVPFLSKEGNAQGDSPESGDKQKLRQSGELQVLKTYIDQRFSELERKIDKFEQNMKEMERRQDEKLDLIISMLNKSQV